VIDEYDDLARERFVVEAPKSSGVPRSPFERDRARVLHSSALRRLAGKTQVVGVGVDVFPRTRLTHSLECAQVGRELAAALGADPDLVDTACLAHDLGHPPFGHNGETALDEAARQCGGFEGNAQSFRLLTRLETKVIGEGGRSAGLNLTRACLDAATKYPWTRRPGDVKWGAYADDADLLAWVRAASPEGVEQCLEAQVMDWSDDVAYSVHDLEDSVHAGDVDLHRLDHAAVVARASAYSSADAALLDAALRDLEAQDWWMGEYDGTSAAQVALKRMTSELIARLCAAALAATRERWGTGALVRYRARVEVPEKARAECALLKAITAHYVMDLETALHRQAGERDLLLSLVDALSQKPEAMDPAHRELHDIADDDAGRRRAVIDQVASLTDGSARAWAAQLC
jgi:dGTPase